MNNWTSVGVIISIIALIYTMSRDIIERIRSQAIQITCWLDYDLKRSDDGKIPVSISNPSGIPIYDVVISVDLVCEDWKKGLCGIRKESKQKEYVQCIPPGLYYVHAPYEGEGGHQKFSASISFRDSGGHKWKRDAIGKLHMRNCYSISRPAESAVLYRYEN